MINEPASRRLREIMAALASHLGALEDQVLSCCGVTVAQCQTLVEIGHAEKLSLGDLAARLGLDNSTLSRTVNNLVTKGLCERDENPEDRRYLDIKLTNDGAKLFGGIEQGMDGWYSSLFNTLPEEKRAQVLESLELLLEAVKKTGICCG